MSGIACSTSFCGGLLHPNGAHNPELTNEQVERMLLDSADDIGVPGWDHFFGAGRLNAYKGLKADPNYFLTAKVDEVAVVENDGELFIHVHGTATANDLDEYEIQLGQGDNPTEWKKVFDEDDDIVDGLVGQFPATVFTDVGTWTVRLVVKHDDGRIKEARGSIDVG